MAFLEGDDRVWLYLMQETFSKYHSLPFNVCLAIAKEMDAYIKERFQTPHSLILPVVNVKACLRISWVGTPHHLLSRLIIQRRFDEGVDAVLRPEDVATLKKALDEVGRSKSAKITELPSSNERQEPDTLDVFGQPRTEKGLTGQQTPQSNTQASVQIYTQHYLNAGSASSPVPQSVRPPPPVQWFAHPTVSPIPRLSFPSQHTPQLAFGTLYDRTPPHYRPVSSQQFTPHTTRFTNIRLEPHTNPKSPSKELKRKHTDSHQETDVSTSKKSKNTKE